MTNLFRFTLIVFLFTFVSTNSYAQDDPDLREYEDFFLDKEPSLTKWLVDSKLGQFMQYQNMEVRKKQVNFTFKTANWNALSDSVKTNTRIALEELLIDKTQFIFNLEPEQVLMKIDTGQATLFIGFEQVEDNLTLAINSRTNQGTISANLAVEIKELNLPGSETYSTDQTIDIMKKKLHKELDEYFKEKEVKGKFGDYSMKHYFRIKDRLKIKVRNVQNIVKKGYYESINIDFFFAKTDDKVTINYTLNCKYGSGFLFSPFEEDYIEVDEQKMEDFNDDLQELILMALTH